MPFETIYTRVEAEVKEKLEKFCAENKTTMKSTVENALLEYMDKYRKNSKN